MFIYIFFSEENLAIVSKVEGFYATKITGLIIG